MMKQKKHKRMMKHKRILSLRGMIITRIKLNLQPIVSENNDSQPISNVILPYFLIKSLCGLAVVHN